MSSPEPHFNPAPVALGKPHARRLREIYRSAGWPSQDPLEIVVAIEFDLDPAALLSMMNSDTGREMVLKTIFQIAQAG